MIPAAGVSRRPARACRGQNGSPRWATRGIQRRAKAGACRRQGLPKGGLGEYRQAPRHGPVGDRLDTDFTHHPQRVLLTGRLDDPGQHQISEHLITSGRVIKPEPGIGPAQGIPQMPRMRTDDFQRRTGDAGRVAPQRPLGHAARQHALPTDTRFRGGLTTRLRIDSVVFV